MILQDLGLPVAISAALGVCVLYVVTGGLHEDGLADVADGFGGGASRERKLAIMRDSRVGTYGVAAMVFSILLRILAIVSIADAASVAMALLAAGALSRAAIGLVMAALPSARTDGLAAATGRPGGGQTLLAIGIAMVGAIAFLGFGAGISVTVLALMTLCLVAALAKKQIGGQTGDVLGTTAQCVEIVVLQDFFGGLEFCVCVCFLNDCKWPWVPKISAWVADVDLSQRKRSPCWLPDEFLHT